jgi:GT2 family glycosyltransferase
MNGTTPQVSIIVINYNTPDLTATLIESAVQVTTNISFDICVVDNGSEPDRRFKDDTTNPLLKVIVSELNLGFGKAVNLAARNCSAPYLLFANSDCRLVADIIPAMAAYLDEHSDCAACSPQLIREDGSVHSSVRHFPNHRNIRHSRGSILGARDDYTIPADGSRKQVEAMAATFMMVRRDDFARAGGFDERYFMYVEDTDLCLKFHQAGRHVAYLGDLTVIHRWGASTSLHPCRMRLEHHRSVKRYFYKHFPQQRFANALLTTQLFVNLILVSLKMLLSGRKR